MAGTATKVGVIGSGEVGRTLAEGFLQHGYVVMRGSREPQKLEKWRKGAGKDASVGDLAATAKFGEVVVFAVKGSAAEEAVHLAGPGSLAGKTVIDAMNPIADAPPKDGVLSFFTKPDESLLERLQRAAPAAEFVKAFSSVGAAFMVDPDFGGQKPTMFVCGNSERAKAVVRGILEEFGWDSEDVGGAASARAVEPLCILWCLPGFLRNEWNHAFKLLKK
jgi:predicted dinucleotide-binding enzyme